MLYFQFFWILVQTLCLNNPVAPDQPADGYGGSVYNHDSIQIIDCAETQDGFWLYQPQSPRPDSARVIVFLHGYGALNPMIYGGWIKHLVRKGNIVIFPRYQKNLFSPSPDKFPSHAAKGIRDALDTLKNGTNIYPLVDQFSLVGHSYGGVISANMGVNYDSLKIPKPKSILLCSPGSGPFKGAVLDSYKDLPAELNLVIMVSENDRVVGDKFGKKIFESGQHISNIKLLRQYADKHGKPSIKAGHNECYALDKQLDSGLRNPTAARAIRTGKTNAVDYYGYWKIFDGLLDCAKDPGIFQSKFNTNEWITNMGHWSDDTPIKRLEVCHVTPQN